MIDLGGDSILEEAQRVVDGPRQQDYGTPVENHQRTADLWTAYLHGKYGIPFEVSAEDVCFLNILQKVSRGINGLTRDTLVDIAGYARNIELIQDARRRAGQDDDLPPVEYSLDAEGYRHCKDLLEMRESTPHR